MILDFLIFSVRFCMFCCCFFVVLVLLKSNSLIISLAISSFPSSSFFLFFPCFHPRPFFLLDGSCPTAVVTPVGFSDVSDMPSGHVSCPSSSPAASCSAPAPSSPPSSSSSSYPASASAPATSGGKDKVLLLVARLLITPLATKLLPLHPQPKRPRPTKQKAFHLLQLRAQNHLFLLHPPRLPPLLLVLLPLLLSKEKRAMRNFVKLRSVTMTTSRHHFVLFLHLPLPLRAMMIVITADTVMPVALLLLLLSRLLPSPPIFLPSPS